MEWFEENKCELMGSSASSRQVFRIIYEETAQDPCRNCGLQQGCKAFKKIEKAQAEKRARYNRQNSTLTNREYAEEHEITKRQASKLRRSA